MIKNSQVNVRFDEQTDNLLEETAKSLGVSKSALVRHLTKTFLDDVKKSGSLKMKPNWVSLLEPADARSTSR
jgi:hypothetical protein